MSSQSVINSLLWTFQSKLIQMRSNDRFQIKRTLYNPQYIGISYLLNIYSFLTLLSSIHFLRSFDFEMVSSERHWNHLNWFNGQLENMSWLENPLKRFAVPFLNITNKRTEKYQLLAVRLENAPNVRCWFFFFIWVRMVWLCAYEPLTIGMHVVGYVTMLYVHIWICTFKWLWNVCESINRSIC